MLWSMHEEFVGVTKPSNPTDITYLRIRPNKSDTPTRVYLGTTESAKFSPKTPKIKYHIIHNQYIIGHKWTQSTTKRQVQKLWLNQEFKRATQLQTIGPHKINTWLNQKPNWKTVVFHSCFSLSIPNHKTVFVLSILKWLFNFFIQFFIF